MDFEKEIRNKLLIRGFKNDTLINNRGLIGATIDEVILMTVKKLAIHNVIQQRELLIAFLEMLENTPQVEIPLNVGMVAVDEYLATDEWIKYKQLK